MRPWVIALVAGIASCGIVSAAGLTSAAQQPASEQAAAQKPAQQAAAPGAQKPAPPAPAAAKPAPANRFANFDDEEDEKDAKDVKGARNTKDTQAAPAAAGNQTPTPAGVQPAPANRFANFDDEEDEEDAEQAKDAKGAKAAPGTKTAPQNRFALDDEEVATPKARSFTYTGAVRCARCHAKQAATYRTGSHGRSWDDRSPAASLGCETCHGPGQAHDDEPAEKELVLRAFSSMSPREINEFCATCHNRRNHSLWQGSQHETRNVHCLSCHSIHNAQSERGHLKGTTLVTTCASCHREKAARMQRTSHMPVREGKMDCSSCHAPHGSTNVRLLKTGGSVNESCLSCHAEKRGPFLWDHAPVRESCTSCHDAHGSSNDRMLVAKGTMLCQRCHIHSRHPSTIYDGLAITSRSNRLVGRGCVNCHQNIHGSNHPSGQFLAR